MVELYAADTATGITRPAQHRLARVDLGASKTVQFVVPMSLLVYTGITGEVVMARIIRCRQRDAADGTSRRS